MILFDLKFTIILIQFTISRNIKFYNLLDGEDISN